MPRVLLFLFVLTASGFAPMAPKKVVADKATSVVTYAMRHPMHAWKGVSKDVNAVMVYDEATRQIQTVAVAIRLASFDSKNESRDSHMIEVLDGLKHPNVTFTSQDIKAAADGALTATGKLTFHNVTRPITVQVTRREEGGKLILEGTFPVKMTDYSVERPTLLGLATQDEFTMSFTLGFKI